MTENPREPNPVEAMLGIDPNDPLNELANLVVDAERRAEAAEAETARLREAKQRLSERAAADILASEQREKRLRETLAKVEALADRWSREHYPDTGDSGWNQGYDFRREEDTRLLREAALASVPAVDAGDREPASEVQP